MTLYSPEMTEKICALLAQGYAVHEIAKMDGMPSHATIFNWAWQKPEFYEAFDKAREFGAHAMNYKLIQEITDSNPQTPGEIAKMKILVDQYRWFIGKINQRKYGDRTILAGDKDNPIAIGIAAALDNRINQAKSLPPPDDNSVQALPVIDIEAVETID